jgi:hypothetical protein
MPVRRKVREGHYLLDVGADAGTIDLLAEVGECATDPTRLGSEGGQDQNQEGDEGQDPNHSIVLCHGISSVQAARSGSCSVSGLELALSHHWTGWLGDLFEDLS